MMNQKSIKKITKAIYIVLLPLVSYIYFSVNNVDFSILDFVVIAVLLSLILLLAEFFLSKTSRK